MLRRRLKGNHGGFLLSRASSNRAGTKEQWYPCSGKRCALVSRFTELTAHLPVVKTTMAAGSSKMKKMKNE